MKTALFIACLAVAAYLVPASVEAAPKTRRDGVTCTQKYIGNLHAVRLGGGYGATPGVPNNTVVLADNKAKTLTIDEARVAAAPMQFQFDNCTTAGWNKGNLAYGQVKPVQLADEVQCVTVEKTVASGFENDKGRGPRELFVHTCGSYNGGILERQWFSANYYNSSVNGQYVELRLRGNPNAPYSTDVREAIVTYNDTSRGIKGAVAAEPLAEPEPITLVLYNVTQVI